MKKIAIACFGVITSPLINAFTQSELAALQEIEQVERQVLSVFSYLVNGDIALCHPQAGKKCRYTHPKPE